MDGLATVHGSSILPLFGFFLQFGVNEDHDLRGTFSYIQISVQSISQQSNNFMKSKHMCTWAYELLGNDPFSTGLDFRRFHRRYAEIFGSRDGRCLLGSIDPCEGKSPSHCHRFTGRIIEDQSAHDRKCSKSCIKMTWDETSYRNVERARAVSLMKKILVEIS